MARDLQLKRQRDRERDRVQKRADRDVFIDFSKQNMRRRGRVPNHPEYFLRRYFPHLFYNPFSDNQKYHIEQIALKMRYGDFKAIAAPRGEGKTTITKGMVVWGIVCGFIKWVPWVEANSQMATDSIEDIKLLFEKPYGEDLFGQDYPEYCAPIRALDRQAMRAKSQTYCGEFTYMRWGVGEIQLPQIPAEKTPNKTGAAGAIIQGFGAEKAIRGLVREGRRPDFIAINDLETEDTARSPTVTNNIRKNVVKGILGLGGQGQKIGCVMLCTIITRGCLADQFTNRKLYPQWQGERQKMVITMPDNMEMWQTYIYKRQQEQEQGLPVSRDADAYYRANRKLMDAGCVLSNPFIWDRTAAPDGYPKEISPVQHVFNLIADRGMEYFLCECQNEPPEEQGGFEPVSRTAIETKVNGYARGEHVGTPTATVGFIDVHADKLFWAVTDFHPGFVGYIIDYGVHRVLSPIAGTVTEKERQQQVELAILTALHELRSIFTKKFDPTVVYVDSGWMPDPVCTFVKEAATGIYRPSLGQSGRPGKYRSPAKPSPTIRNIGNGFHYSFHRSRGLWVLHQDADKWKRRAQEGFLTPGVDNEGSLSLFGRDPMEHRPFAEHIVAEAWSAEKQKYEKVPGLSHNHWLDCVAGCCFGAEVLGVKLINNPPRPPRKNDEQMPRQQRKKRMDSYLGDL